MKLNLDTPAAGRLLGRLIINALIIFIAWSFTFFIWRDLRLDFIGSRMTIVAIFLYLRHDWSRYEEQREGR